MRKNVFALLLCGLVSAAHADVFNFIFGPTVVQGTVGSVQSTYFTLVSPDNRMLQVFPQPGQLIPPNLKPGMFIQASVGENEYRQVILEELQAIQGPNGTLLYTSEANQP